MRDLCRLIGWMIVDLLWSRATLEAEIWTLRQQINVLRRAAPKKLSFSTIDRLIFVGLYRLFPRVCDALAIIKPDTVVRWHRAGFRFYWRWKSRCRGGRPTVPLEIRDRAVRGAGSRNQLPRPVRQDRCQAQRQAKIASEHRFQSLAPYRDCQLPRGGQIVGAERIPMNTVDFAPYAERIANAKPDAVIT